eukprot:1148902-Pelagomonas_calceolata.AAC.5
MGLWSFCLQLPGYRLIGWASLDLQLASAWLSAASRRAVQESKTVAAGILCSNEALTQDNWGISMISSMLCAALQHSWVQEAEAIAMGNKCSNEVPTQECQNNPPFTVQEAEMIAAGIKRSNEALTQELEGTKQACARLENLVRVANRPPC